MSATKPNYAGKNFKTRPKNTRECVHFIIRGHFRSRDKDGGHTIGSAIAKNPMLHTQILALALSVIEPEL